MKRIEKQGTIAAAAKKLAGRKKLEGITAADKAFVNGAPFNVVGLVLSEAQKDLGEDGERIIFPRKMNGQTSAKALALAIGVDEAELPQSVTLALGRLEAVKEMNETAAQALKDFAANLKALIGRAPGRPKGSKATTTTDTAC